MGWARVHTCRVTGGGTDRWVGLESVRVGLLEAEGGRGGWVGLETAGLTENNGVCFSV